MAPVAQRYKNYDDDMKKLKSQLRELGYMERPIGWVSFSWVYNFILTIVPAVAFFYTDIMVLKIVLSFLAGVGAVGVGTCAHNASHGVSFKTKGMNRFMDLLGFTLVMGVSSRFWDNFHNKLHHPNTSVINVDPDTTVLPWFALHQKQVQEAHPLWQKYFKIQYLFFPFLVGFYSIFLQYMGWAYMAKKFKNWGSLESHDKKMILTDLVVLGFHYLFWIALFSQFFPWWQVLILYVSKNWVTGLFCFFALAPTHWDREALYFDQSIMQEIKYYYARQMFSTINYKVGFFGSLIANGVEYHLEHHLFPQVSHVHLPAIAKRVEALCKKHKMPYRTKSWARIIFDSYKVVKEPKPVDNSLADKLVSTIQ